jgi:biopolymer transport protein ExbD
MRHIVLGGCVLAACGHGDPRDEAGLCDVVRRDPQHAVTSVGAKVPGDPVRIARTIEDCIAPSGDECERVARLVAAIPSMMPKPSAIPIDGDYRQMCRDEPPEMRRCLLPSYVLGHVDECQRIQEKIAASTIVATPKSTRWADCENRGAIALEVMPGGIWLGINDTTRCFGRRRGTALDKDWLQTELGQLTRYDCRPSVEIAGEASVAYQDLISVMDVATKLGFVEVALVPSAEVVVSFAKLDPAAASPSCSRGAPKVRDHVAAAALPRATGRDTSAAAPVIAISKTAIWVAGKDVVSTADAANASGPIAALEQALPHVTSGTVILQADEATSASVIHHVVKTLQHAGYDGVLFAVQTP